MIAPTDDRLPTNTSVQFALRVVAGEFIGGEFPITKDRFVVGRGERSDLRLLSHRISRSHCVFVRTERGLVVTDLISRTGTLVNGTRIKPSARLKLDDHISVDSCMFKLVAISGPAAVGSSVVATELRTGESHATRPSG